MLTARIKPRYIHLHGSTLRSLLIAGLLAAWSLGASGAATAATLNLVADKPSYAVGETVTIRLVGDSESAVDNALFAGIDIDRAALLDPQVTNLLPLTGTPYGWIQGGVRGCIFTNPRYPNRCVLINAIYWGAGGELTGVEGPEPFTWAVFTATAAIEGTYAINFHPIPNGNLVDFFGLTTAPGTTILIHNPEPGTAALLALGLAGLSLARRRRRD